jgi:hypothetical protein
LSIPIFSNSTEALERLQRLSASIQRFRERILPARKWFIAHFDLAAVRLDQPLGAASGAEWNQFWLDLQDFLDLMFRHHAGSDNYLYLNAIGNMSDADSLITALRNAKFFHAIMSD